ncbi:hypothetical protein BH23VER1_BH23VER1_33970 [soil metagenome]
MPKYPPPPVPPGDGQFHPPHVPQGHAQYHPPTVPTSTAVFHPPAATDYQVEARTHALAPEHKSDEDLHRSQRKSKFIAMSIAVGVHVIIILVAALVIIVSLEEETAEITAIPGDETVADLETDVVTPHKRGPPTASSSQVSQVISSSATSEISVPVVEDIFTEDPVDLSAVMNTDLGMNPFTETSFSSFLPSSMSSRCTSKDRETRLKETGGKPGAEEAVVGALKWLKNQQNQDGSFGQAHRTAMTGLAILAYLGHCDTPDSPEFGDTVTNAILYLVETAIKGDGAICDQKSGNEWAYEHGIGTYALAEAYSITKYGKRKFPRIRQALELAVPIIIEGQKANGAWAYEFNKGGGNDTSVAGWQIQALKAAQYTKLEFVGLNEAMDHAMKFLVSAQAGSGAFGYRGAEDARLSLTGVGALCLIMGTQNTKSAEVRKGIDFIIDNTELKWESEDISLYHWYYATQACFQRGGSDWTKWNRGFQDEILKAQNDDGSWPPEGPKGNPVSGAATSTAAGCDAEIYRTALCTLMLEVYYRYLPTTETDAHDTKDGSFFGS